MDTTLRILSVSCVYPNPSEPAHGIFVRRRLEKVGQLADVKVIAPVPLLDYARPLGRWTECHTIPERRTDGPLEVFHPRWVYPPFGGAVNPACLFARLAPFVRGLKRKFPFAVLDAHFAFPDGIAAALLAASLSVPFTVTLRGNEPMHAGSAVLRTQIRWALSRAARVITVSRRLADFAASLGTQSGKLRVIPNGVDTTVFRPLDRAACRRSLGISENARVIASAGSLIERKGHHHVMRAVRALRDRGTPVQLLIAGGRGREGPRGGRNLQALARELNLNGALQFLGAVQPDALAAVMSAADVFCLASSREGWPNVVHEALACGTPVVATDVGAVPDMISSDAMGCVVPPNDAGALENALALALARSWNRDEIRAEAHKRSWDMVARETLAELRAAAAQGATA